MLLELSVTKQIILGLAFLQMFEVLIDLSLLRLSIMFYSVNIAYYSVDLLALHSLIIPSKKSKYACFSSGMCPNLRK